jgi:hypothetical protein
MHAPARCHPSRPALKGARQDEVSDFFKGSIRRLCVAMMDLTAFWDWFRELHAVTGIKLTIFYDAFDRARFINGFLTSVRLMAFFAPSRRPISSSFATRRRWSSSTSSISRLDRTCA